MKPAAQCLLLATHLLYLAYSSALDGSCADSACLNVTSCANVTDSTYNCTCVIGFIGELCDQEFGFDVPTPAVPEVGETVDLTVTLTRGSIDPGSVTVNVTGATVTPNPPRSYTYKIASVAFSSIGTYTFTAFVTYNGSDDTATVSISIPHVLTVLVDVADATKYLLQDNPASLSAKVTCDGSFDNVGVRVTGPQGLDKDLTSTGSGTGSTRTYTLDLGTVTAASDGTYTFTATETYDGHSRSQTGVTTVVVEDPPTTPDISESDPLIVIRGVEKTVTCESTGKPVPTITWLYGGTEVSTSITEPVYRRNDGSLTFSQSTPFDRNGTYTCKASNTLISIGGITREDTSTIAVTINGPPELQVATKPPLQKETVDMECTFHGYPLPIVSWYLDNVQLTDFDGIYGRTDSSEFFYQAKSKLTISHSALCLGERAIQCRAGNGITNPDTTTKVDTFNINNQNYDIFKDTYVIFSTEADFDGIDCGRFGGTPLNILDSESQTSVTSIADTFAISEFYIGAKYENSRWEWSNGDEVVYVDWVGEAPSSGCAVLKKSNDEWKWSSNDCLPELTYACQVEATHFPSNLIATPKECDGTAADISWNNDGFFSQMVELTPSVSSYSPDINASSVEISSLTPGTLYTAKVSTGDDFCALYPFDEVAFRTTYANLASPALTVTETCDVTWSYPEDRPDKPEGFNLTVTETLLNRPSEVFSATTRRFPSTATAYPFSSQPNTKYDFRLTALSDCTGSSDPTTIQSCSVPVDTPSEPLPVLTPISSEPTDTEQGIGITVQEISTRYGNIPCQYIVARWTTSESEFSNIANIDTEFGSIKQADQEVAEGEDYFALALPNGRRNVTLGSGNEDTSCPTARRRRRAISNSASVSARNRPLQPDARYQYYLIVARDNGTHLLLQASPWSPQVQVNQVPPDPPIAAIVVPIVLILLIIVLLLLFCYWRKTKNKRKESQFEGHSMRHAAHANPAFSDANIYENTRANDHSIAVENLRSTYREKHSDEDRLFREEYRTLAMEVSELSLHFSYSMALEVREKNRFSNIHPTNESRVVLRRQGTDIYSDYINASYMDGYRQPRKYIAAQGPMPSTIGDFWYMVWEQESTVVVMLTRVEESGRKKCEKYWPDDSEQVTFENIMVKAVSTVVYGPITKRTFLVSNPNQSEKRLAVEQFHFTAWPDHGVPVTTSDLFRLRRMVLESQGNSPSPIVVHCSAGVGRTGTFVAHDVLSNQLDRESKVDVYGVVLGMRKKRKEMVQTVEQYSLLHKLMLEKHLFGETDTKTANFHSTLGNASAYEVIDSIEEGFYNLSLVPPVSAVKFFPPHESHKVRDKEIVPYQHSKVIIRMRPSEQRPPFINASFIQTYNTCDAFIACQGPVEASLEDFWRVVLDSNVTVVVMLSKLREKGKEQSAQYWPENIQNPKSFGDIIVSLQTEIRSGGYVERYMQVSEKVLHLRRSLSVMQLQYEDWEDNSAPPDASVILDIIAKTQLNRKTTQGKTSPVMVHCSDGSGRTGTFCAIVNLIERLKNEDRIDVFRTVKDLRDMRPLMVRTLDQYRFCYKAVQEYLSSFDLYANFK